MENLSVQYPVWFDDLEIQTGACASAALPTALVVQETHYDPWGLELAGIGYNASGNPEHRWKYNGIEHNANFGLNWLEAKFRALDPALGRWNKVDPRPSHGISPYAAMDNNPVRFSDPLGDTVRIRFGGFLGIGSKTVIYNNGTLTRTREDGGGAYTGKRTRSLRKVVAALESSRAVTAGASLVNSLQASQYNFTIERGYGSNSFAVDNADASQGFGGQIGSGGTIKWSTTARHSGPNTSGNTRRPTFLALIHEMGHGESASRGAANRNPFDIGNRDAGLRRVSMDEYNAVHWENRVRSQYGIPLREFYTKDTDKRGFMPFVNAGTSTATNNGYNYAINDPVEINYRGNDSGR